MTARAKWDAWSAAGKTLVQHEDAERRYLDIARNLGWTEDIAVQKAKDDSVTLSDTRKDSLVSSNNPGAGGGMGVAVSVMLPPVQDPDESIHGFAISNNASALSALLELNPATNVNELDEFVS
jgi:hypothetical protein